MNTQYPTGTRLLIELSSCKIYEATFIYSNNGKIAAADVTEYPENIIFGNVSYFYIKDIKSITVLDEVEPQTEENNYSRINASVQYDKLKQMSYNYHYIAVVDSNFHDTLQYLKMCTDVAVFGFGCIYGRRSKISLLAIATNKEIYLFDIIISGKRGFDLGIREILEANHITKTVHDSKMLADCLYHYYNVKLKNVFDTQVTDYMISQKDGGTFPEQMRIFADIVHNYLNLPTHIVKNIETDLNQLMMRPLSDRAKLNSALQVAYLFTLGNILNKRLLQNFNLTTECFLNSVKDEKDDEKALKLLELDVPPKVKELNITL